MLTTTTTTANTTTLLYHQQHQGHPTKYRIDFMQRRHVGEKPTASIMLSWRKERVRGPAPAAWRVPFLLALAVAVAVAENYSGPKAKQHFVILSTSQVL